MATKSKKNDKTKLFVRVVCVFLAFLMVLSAIAALTGIF